MADGNVVPVQAKILVQEIVKIEFEIQNLVQEIRNCRGPLSSLDSLNFRVKKKMVSLREKVESLDQIADEQDKESDVAAVKALKEYHKKELASIQASTRKANLESKSVIDKMDKEELLGGEGANIRKRFVQAAVSLAVVIPSLLDLQAKLYGVEKGIPTLVMAAASFDNVMCISAFGVCLGMAFSSGNLIFTIFRGPIELVMGISFGGLIGVMCWYFPSKTETDLSHNRFVLLLVCATFAVFGSNAASFSGAGALAVLTMATVAAFKWGIAGKAPIANAMAIVWTFFEPLLFGLVGAAVNVEYMESSLLGKGIGMLVISLIVRFIVTYFALLGNNLDKKERLFIALAWLPKATVQAAIGSNSLDTARLQGFSGQYQEEFGIQILTIAILGILVTSPIGAIGISVAGPRTLQQARPDNVPLAAERNASERNTEGATLQESQKITEV